MWAAFNLAQKIYFCIAVAASAMLVVQLILTLVGVFGDGADADMDIDADGSDGTDFDGDGGMRFLSFRGLVAFFAMGGWVGFGLSATGMHIAGIVAISFVVGAASLFGVAYLFKLISKLQYDGTMHLANGVGKVAEVYLPIGANGGKIGKISIEIQGRLTEAEAVTNADRDLKVGERVTVTGMQSGTLFTVEPLAAAKPETKPEA